MNHEMKKTKTKQNKEQNKTKQNKTKTKNQHITASSHESKVGAVTGLSWFSFHAVDSVLVDSDEEKKNRPIHRTNHSYIGVPFPERKMTPLPRKKKREKGWFLFSNHFRKKLTHFQQNSMKMDIFSWTIIQYHVSQKKRVPKNTDNNDVIYKNVLNKVISLTDNCHIIYPSLAKDRNDYHKVFFKIWLQT